MPFSLRENGANTVGFGYTFRENALAPGPSFLQVQKRSFQKPEAQRCHGHCAEESEGCSKWTGVRSQYRDTLYRSSVKSMGNIMQNIGAVADTAQPAKLRLAKETIEPAARLQDG